MSEDIHDHEESENKSRSVIDTNKSQVIEHSSSEELGNTQSCSIRSSREDDFKKPMQKSTSLKTDKQKRK